MRSQQQGIGRRAPNNANFADAALDGALGGFQLKNHAPGDDTALDQSFDFPAADGGENSLAIEDTGDIGEINQLMGAEVFRARSSHVVGVDIVQLVVRTQAEA